MNITKRQLGNLVHSTRITSLNGLLRLFTYNAILERLENAHQQEIYGELYWERDE